ncbi:MAG TPA: hypothetical protein VK550_19460 [Polyangiaceae bacterium]|jgi:hypothetical protein|nr:hypothetical protein [Polyangiaceae bacterium]
MRFLGLAWFVALGSFAGCGGKTNLETGDAAAKDSATPGLKPMCSWSANLEPLDAAPTRDSCRAARALVRCTASDGSTTFCITNKTECDVPKRPGITYACEEVCKSNEFGAACGTITGASVSPPAECRSFPPSGEVFYCCACTF